MNHSLVSAKKKERKKLLIHVQPKFVSLKYFTHFSNFDTTVQYFPTYNWAAVMPRTDGLLVNDQCKQTCILSVYKSVQSSLLLLALQKN